MVLTIALVLLVHGRLASGRRALTESRTWAASVTEGAAEYALVIDANGVIVFASTSMERVLGFKPCERVGQNAIEDELPGDAEPVRAAFTRALANPGVAQYVDCKARHKDGHWVEVAATLRNLLHDPIVRGVIVNVRDASIERAIAAELRQTEQRHRDILNALPLMVYSVEPAPPYKPIFISQGHQLLGYSPEEWMVRDLWTSVLHPDDREWVLQSLARALERGEPAELEYRVVDKHGAVRWLVDRSRLVFDAAGKASAWHGALTDVTDRVEAARALQLSEDRYRNIFDGSVAANFVSTPGGKLIACNATFAKLFGFATVADALQLNVREAYANPDTRQEWLAKIRREGALEAFEIQLRRPDGRAIHVLENARGIFDEKGNLTEIHGYLLDVTERRRLEQNLRQSAKMEAVGRLAGGIAHDFNNLLSVIGSYATLVRGTLPPASDAYADLTEIGSAVDRGAALTRQLLTFSRARVPEVSLFEVDAAIKNAESMVRRLLGPEIALSLELEGRDAKVRMDPSQLDQILVNLLVNAADAMPSGGCITVSTSRVRLGGPGSAPVPAVPVRGEYVWLQVRDTGVGMDAETAARAAEPFFTTKDVGRGTGLGLATVFGIVEQAGGHLSIDSRVGEGTTMTIYLPAAADAAVEQAGAESPAAQPAPRGTRVLVVDDEEGVRKTLARILDRRGFAVTTAGSGEAALALWKERGGAFDLVITDIRMPTMSGFELIARLREVAPSVPVLAMSGYPEDDMRAVEGVRFIEKPFAMGKIVEAVREAVAGVGV
ncbi:MAG TPA: PAS domain S-box protein [Gemmatimonadaceae bacterium]|nr:PAS domain S-box protein [Gemmatimonadaceae bacterium]